MPTALVAEDEILIRELVVEELTDAGFAVKAVGTGDEAFASIERAMAAGETFDLLFTDIRMPGTFDGWELGRRARAAAPGIMVIYSTGYSDSNVVLAANERRITKPYRYEELLVVLRELGLCSDEVTG